jgi:hyperosmotically inducible periplasmic protein
MRTLLILIVLLALGAGAYFYLRSERSTDQLQRAESEAARRAEQVRETVKEKWQDLNVADIKQELEHGGTIVRKKAEKVGAVIADATADARITGTIKAKLVKDPTLSALQISVNTTDGVVTLSGSVGSAEEVRQAMKVALETDGVREAISTLQVKTKK